MEWMPRGLVLAMLLATALGCGGVTAEQGGGQQTGARPQAGGDGSVAAARSVEDGGEPTGKVSDEASSPAQPPAEPKHGDRWTNGLGMEFVYLKPGSFMMGSPEDEPHRYEDEAQHRVVLSAGFWMGVTEVTQKQWNDLMGPNFCYFKGDDVPIESVTWHDAGAFCRKLSKRDGRRYRLPTEAEWEYACRGGTTTAFHFGDFITTKQVNFDGRVHFYGTETEGRFLFRVVPVKSHPPNGWGLYEMHGNVAEWCADWYGPYPSGEVTDPKGPAEGTARVIRGGCWQSYQRDLRSANRQSHDPTMMHYTNGFRVVLEG